MGTIICQDCESVIDHFDCEKVSVLYGKCCESCTNEASLQHTES
ncbi:GapA-binding peptide SR1P [Salipaludibacillus sp. CUR1]|nr:GapA-binding peptide SR1P [Salipaludibacillus sp. CUR1]MCE7791709.1 GapA-binding peptide SR1P [Salipaludibacillus sp. CUR1]